MSQVKIFWQPDGFTLDTIGNKRYLRHTDGDTPYISTGIRMLSIDTPEVHYPGNSSPVRSDDKLAELARWIEEGKAPIDDGLAAHLQPRLAEGRAGSRQKEQGDQATAEFSRLVATRLKRPSGTNRNLFIRIADQPFDRYGRLLAYLAPAYNKAERKKLSRLERGTFNLLMVESGWAATFLIYPSLPGQVDLDLFHEVAAQAVRKKRGAWADPLVLTGYEFRMAFKLWETTRKLNSNKAVNRTGWVSRYCVDLTTRVLYEPQDYHRVAPQDRLFLWSKEVREAVGTLNLVLP